MAADLFDAIRQRRERAVEVAETYDIEFVGAQAWVVQHDEEPERCYLVDMIARRCSCPDHECYRIEDRQIDCKHIVAIIPLWEKQTGLRDKPFRYHGVPTDECGFTSVRDVDADGQDPFERV